MKCIFFYDAKSIKTCEKLTTAEYEDFEKIIDDLDRIVLVDTCFAMVRDAMREMTVYHAGDNCRKNTAGILKDLFWSERKIRAVLFEIRAYHEHITGALSKARRKKYLREMEQARTNHPVFAFVWELRNYVTHEKKVVERFEDDINGDSHPFPNNSELLNYKGKCGNGWSDQAKQYILGSNGRIDLVEAIQEAFDILFEVHKKVIKGMAGNPDTAAALKTAVDKKTYIMQKYRVLSKDMWQYQIGRIVYVDDSTEVSEEEFEKPTDGRKRSFYSVPINWEIVTDIMQIVSDAI